MASDDFDPTEQTLVKRPPAEAAPAIRLGHYLSYLQEGRPRRVRITQTGITIGRHPSCDIVFPVPEVSRQHCRVQAGAQDVVLTDLGSTNGTFLSGTRLEQPVRLVNGTVVTIGSFLLRYEQRDERELEAEERLTAELRQAVEYVRAILPEPIGEGPVQAEWWYVPSSELGGDAFGYRFLDPQTFIGFLIDVSGHGLGAGLHAVNVANTLRRAALPGVDFRDPGQVAAGLNAMFPMEQHGGLILTLWYFAYDLTSRTLRYCSAGHHPALLAASGSEPAPVGMRAPSIGMLPPRPWPAQQIAIPPDSRLYLFSDGAFEIEQPDGSTWQIENLRRIIAEPARRGMPEAQRIYEAVRMSAKPGPLADDFSMLVLRFA